jgi:hypothetical protein
MSLDSRTNRELAALEACEHEYCARELQAAWMRLRADFADSSSDLPLRELWWDQSAVDQGGWIAGRPACLDLEVRARDLGGICDTLRRVLAALEGRLRPTGEVKYVTRS